MAERTLIEQIREYLKGLWKDAPFSEFLGGLLLTLASAISVLELPFRVKAVLEIALLGLFAVVRWAIHRRPKQSSGSVDRSRILATTGVWRFARYWYLPSAVGMLLGLLASLASSGVIPWYRMPPGRPQAVPTKELYSGNSPIVGGTHVTNDAIYYTQQPHPNQFVPMVLPLEGNEARAVMTEAQASTVIVGSHLGALLLRQTYPPYRDSASKLWTLPLTHRRALTAVHDAGRDGAWSPDGAWLAYTVRNTLRRVRSAAVGAESHVLYESRETSDVLSWPRWSADGRTIRFTKSTPFQAIWEIAVPPDEKTSDAEARRVFPRSEQNECCGDWAVNGAYFVFEREASTSAARIMIVSAEHEDQPPVPLMVHGFHSTSVQPNGLEMVARNEHLSSRVVRIEPRTSKYEPFLAAAVVETLAFSRDGQRIAYSDLRDHAVWAADAAGSNAKRLTDDEMIATLPSWSPDGKQLAFVGQEKGRHRNIYTVDSQGGPVSPLTPETRAQLDPTWAPDGKSIAFGRHPELDTLGVELYTIDLQTHRPEVIAGSNGWYSPRWSPDGRYLVAVNAAKNRGLALYDVQARTWLQLTTMQAAYPAWSRDAKYVYFRHRAVDRSVKEQSPEAYSVHRVRVPSKPEDRVSPPEWVCDLRFRGPQALFGWWVGLAPDDSVLATEDRSSYHISKFSLSFSVW